MKIHFFRFLLAAPLLLAACGPSGEGTAPEKTEAREPAFKLTGDPAGTDFVELERDMLRRVNARRYARRLPPLAWDEAVAEAARVHSRAMARGRVPFGHGGFQSRADSLRATIGWRAIAENVAMNNFPRDSVVRRAVKGLVGSPEHLRNIEGDYERSGVGVARNAEGEYYFTQIFIR